MVMVLVAGCGSGASNNVPPQPSALVDTTGARVSWSCKDGHCAAPKPLAGTPAPRPTCVGGGQVPSYGTEVFGSPVAMLCEGCYDVAMTTFTSEGSGCRPLVCTVDADCPQPSFGAVAFGCTKGLCQDPTKQLNYGVVLALCLATVPRSATQDSNGTAAFDASNVATSGCPTTSTCASPASCRQP